MPSLAPARLRMPTLLPGERHGPHAPHPRAGTQDGRQGEGLRQAGQERTQVEASRREDALMQQSR